MHTAEVGTIILMPVMTPQNIHVELRPRGLIELLHLTFSLYRRHFRPFFAIAAVVMGPLAVLTVIGGGAAIVRLAVLTMPGAPAQPGVQAAVATAVFASLISLCAGVIVLVLGAFAPWMGGALTHATIERVLGREPVWRQSYRSTYPRWATLWSANFIRQAVAVACLVPLMAALYGLFVAALIGRATASDVTRGAVGLAAVCSPFALIGLILALVAGVNWSLSEPAIVGENAGALYSLARSNALMSGIRWRMLGRLLPYWLAQFVVLTLPMIAIELAVLGNTAALSAGSTTLVLAGAALFGAVMGVLIAPFNAVYITVNYLDVRVRKERLAEQLQSTQQAAPQAQIETSARV